MEDEKQQAIKWMHDLAVKLIKGVSIAEITDIVYHDQYTGAYAKISFADLTTYKVWDAAEDQIFVDNFPIMNNDPKSESDGWIGYPDEFNKLIKSSMFHRIFIKKCFFEGKDANVRVKR